MEEQTKIPWTEEEQIAYQKAMNNLSNSDLNVDIIEPTKFLDLAQERSLAFTSSKYRALRSSSK